VSEWDKRSLKRWIAELRNPVFVSMDATEDGTAWVRLTAEELVNRSPVDADTGDQLDYLRELSPNGVFRVLRDKWRAALRKS
jgi:hypothetical protein